MQTNVNGTELSIGVVGAGSWGTALANLLAVKGFSACVLGGIGNFPGAVTGGLLIGLIESFGAGLISSGYKDVFALLVLLGVLFVRPSGLFGNVEVSKIKKF